MVTLCKENVEECKIQDVSVMNLRV